MSVGDENYRLQGIQLSRRTAQATLFFEIVRDDRQCDEVWLRAALRVAGPRTRYLGHPVGNRMTDKFPGGHRGRVTPVPIPNTEVKPATADGTACVGVWESRSLPGLFLSPS